jgi:hypothetical protein
MATTNASRAAVTLMIAVRVKCARHNEGNAVMAIKAIPIQYHGHLFRSWLEAKCAVVWQAHGLGNCMFGSNKFVPLFVVMVVVTVLGQTPGFAASSIGSVTLVHEYAYGTVEGGDKNGLFGRDDVYQKEIIETVIDGALHIEFVDETTLRLGSASSVALDTWVYDPNEKNGRMVISMVQGVFRFISGKIYKRGVRLLTPTIAIGIRGTDFTVAIATDGSTSVSVAEGEIEITPIAGGDTVSVTPGQIATVSTTSASVSISSGSTVSTDPGLSEAGSDGGDEGEGGGDGH